MDPARDGLNWYVYTYNNPLKYIDPTGMFGREIHYDATLEWAIEVGFTPQEARIIAEANQGVDSIWSSKNPVLGQSYHFNTNANNLELDSRFLHAIEHMDNFERLANEALNTDNSLVSGRLRTEALDELGKGLHALQDLCAHRPEYVREVEAFGKTWYHHIYPGGQAADLDYGDLNDPNSPGGHAKISTIGYLEFAIELVGWH
jgi:hypothetical protein